MSMDSERGDPTPYPRERSAIAIGKTLLIELFGYLILGYHLTPNGCCPSCGSSIAGKWAPAFQGQITARPFVQRTRPRLDLLVLNS
jgi:hypothetical protein